MTVTQPALTVTQFQYSIKLFPMLKLTFRSHCHSCIIRTLFLKIENRQKQYSEKHNVTGIGEDLAPSFRDRNKFRRPKFLNDLLLGKQFHFTPTIISDYLF